MNITQVRKSLEDNYRFSNIDEDFTLVLQEVVLSLINFLKAQEPAKPVVDIDT